MAVVCKRPNPIDGKDVEKKSVATFYIFKFLCLRLPEELHVTTEPKLSE